MKKVINILMKVVLPLAVGVGIFMFVYKDVQYETVRSVLKDGISWTWVGISLVFALFSHIVRGLRWRLQLRTMGINPSTHAMSVSIFGNYGFNLVFPRLGEIWRCSFIAHNYDVPFSTTLGTMISERAVDMICALLMALTAFALQSHVFFDFFASYSEAGASILQLLTNPWLWLALAVVAALLWVFRKKLSQLRLYGVVKGFLLRIWTGIISLKTMPGGGWYVLYSILIWALYYLNSYTCFFFFGFTEHLSALAALVVFVMGSMSLLIPVQGGLGAWHAMVIFALGCYGITRDEALSFALVSWTIEQGFVLLLGVYALLYILFSKSKIQAAQS